MEQPMFYQGQRVVFIGAPPEIEDKESDPLIEGKSYYIENPHFKHCLLPAEWGVYVTLKGFSEEAWHQRGFIPYETDQALEDEIKSALNEDFRQKNEVSLSV